MSWDTIQKWFVKFKSQKLKGNMLKQYEKYLPCFIKGEKSERKSYWLNKKVFIKKFTLLNHCIF